jgi:hypothetical protein
MFPIDALLARARLHPRPRVPDDTIAYEDCAYLEAADVGRTADEPGADPTAASDLHDLCELVVSTLAPGALDFLTEQLPEPPAAWLLGCALHLAGVSDGARFWWQYAAGAGHIPAAYCLSLHHHARGETHAAAFWYEQTGLLAPASAPPAAAGACSRERLRYDASVPTVLRVLSRLTARRKRPRTHRADAVTNYVADAVAHGYRRYPSVEIPVPEPRFADRLAFILSTTPPWTHSSHGPDGAVDTDLPSRNPARYLPDVRARDTAADSNSR